MREREATGKESRDPIKKLWIMGEPSEDGEEWTEDVREHCSRCCNDVGETSEIQWRRMLARRKEGKDERQMPRAGILCSAEDVDAVTNSRRFSTIALMSGLQMVEFGVEGAVGTGRRMRGEEESERGSGEESEL